jgi:hypothetical protein
MHAHCVRVIARLLQACAFVVREMEPVEFVFLDCVAGALLVSG